MMFCPSVFEEMGHGLLGYLLYTQDNFKITTGSGERLIIDGYVYEKSCRKKGTTYWECPNYKKRECPARATTVDSPLSKGIYIRQGPELSAHNHPQFLEEKEKLRSLFVLDPEMIPYLEFFASKPPPQGWSRRRRRFFIHDKKRYDEFLEKYCTKYAKFDPVRAAETIRSMSDTIYQGIAGYAAVMEYRSRIERDIRNRRKRHRPTSDLEITSEIDVPEVNSWEDLPAMTAGILREPETVDKEVRKKDSSSNVLEAHAGSNIVPPVSRTESIHGSPAFTSPREFLAEPAVSSRPQISLEIQDVQSDEQIFPPVPSATPIQNLVLPGSPKEPLEESAIPSLSENSSVIQDIQPEDDIIPPVPPAIPMHRLISTPPRESWDESAVQSMYQSLHNIQKDRRFEKDDIPPVPGAISIHSLPLTPPRDSPIQLSSSSIFLYDRDDLTEDCRVEKVILYVDLTSESSQKRNSFSTELSGDALTEEKESHHVYAPYCAYNADNQDDDDHDQAVPVKQSRFGI